jgi:phosphate transport system substrate-binding protein
MMRQIIIILLATILLSSCGGKPSEIAETTTRGNISVASDEAFKQMLDAELFIFQTEYKDAKVNPIYTSEGDALDLLMKDSVRFVVIARKLNDQERKFFKDKDLNPKETLIAYDGLTFICNKATTDTTLSFNQMKQLFSGKPVTWKQLESNGSNDTVRVVFDSPKSGNARFLKETFGLNELPKNCFAAKSNEEAIKYVESNPNAIGVVSSNWISDPDDSLTQVFMDRVKVFGISSKEDPDAKNGYHQPYQEYIADGTYPFKRELYIINCEVGTRLGTGFASFIASDKGQRIVLKSGLLPAVIPVRFIEVSNEF